MKLSVLYLLCLMCGGILGEFKKENRITPTGVNMSICIHDFDISHKLRKVGPYE